MDFLDPKKKRAHTIRLFVGYVLVGIALLLAATLLLFASLGYGIKRSTGELTQNGLLFVDAHPEAARIKIDGKDRGQTDGRFVLESGRYNIELSRDGYRSWSRNFTLEGGNIVRLVYPFLFPVNLESAAVMDLAPAPDLVTQSPDRKWIIVHDSADYSTFTVIDTSTDDNERQQIAVPSSVLSSKGDGQTLEVVEWSTDNRHVLLKQTYTGGSTFVILDREKPEESVNVSAIVGSVVFDVNLRDKKADQVYVHRAAGGELAVFDIASKRTEVIASKVDSFWPYKQNTLLYATKHDTEAGQAAIKLKDGNVTYDIRSVTEGQQYLLNIAEFDGALYVVAGSTADGKVYIYKDPITDLKSEPEQELSALLLFRVDGAQFVNFSANARFISVQGGSNFAVYDAETEQQYRYDTKLALAAKQEATWMDGHRLMVVSGGQMVVFDYDNENVQKLVNTEAAFKPMFDRDYNNLFTITRSASGPLQILQTDLNLGKE